MERQRVSTGTKWERDNGYSRAVRAGNLIFVSGTLAAGPDGNIIEPNSAYKQTLYALEKAERALIELGASRRDVVRTRLYVISMNHDREVGRAHAEFFGDVMPCCTLIGVHQLASGLASIEVELDAVVDTPSNG
ncbi:MAG: RidA family protein [Phycisphaerales bacterium]